MTYEVKIRQFDNAVGIALPKAMAARFHLRVGDRVLAIETDQGILLTPCDPTIGRALAIATHAARKYRTALRSLAK